MMPAEIDYAKRDWYQNVFDPGAWLNLLGGVGDVLTESGGAAWEILEKEIGSRPLLPGFTPQYEPPPPPPATLHDLGYSRNEILVVAGGGILLLFLLLKK